jgi:hypothetical protein
MCFYMGISIKGTVSICPRFFVAEVIHEIGFVGLVNIVFQDKVGYFFQELDYCPGELDLHGFFHGFFLSQSIGL